MKNINKTLGIISIVVFFITYLFIGTKSLSTGIEKSSGISGSIAMCLTIIAFLFKVQHWPGTGILIIISLIGLLVTGILLIIDAIKDTDQTKQSIKTLFAFSLTAIVVMLIMITRIFTEILK